MIYKQFENRGTDRTRCSCVLVRLGLSALLLVLGAWPICRHGTLKLRGLSNTLALLALGLVFGNSCAVVGIGIRQAFLLAGRLVGALGLAAGIRLQGSVRATPFHA